LLHSVRNDESGLLRQPRTRSRQFHAVVIGRRNDETIRFFQMFPGCFTPLAMTDQVF
jgi:hypothetical protein